MEAATCRPEQVAIEPPKQHEQLEAVAETNPTHGVQAVQGEKEYQYIRDILAMLETWKLGPTLSTATHD